jgi:asparagine synthase (glutamine-hydrolysing)
MYLLARRIKAMGIKMVLTGEGSDEIFGGYLYFHKAPDAAEFHAETVRKLDQLHLFDCLRANKSLAAWGIEGRVPFLDREFLDVAMAFDARHKMCGGARIEKHVLRSAFSGLLPEEILWRQKEQFSDGVGWLDRHAARARAARVWTSSSPRSRALGNVPASLAYLYRSCSSLTSRPSRREALPHRMSIACSTPTAIRWDAMFQGADPSGRAVPGVHKIVLEEGLAIRLPWFPEWGQKKRCPHFSGVA